MPMTSVPSARQGYAEALADPYYCRGPLPRIPGYHKLDNQAQLAHSAYNVPNVDNLKILHHYARSIPNSLYVVK